MSEKKELLEWIDRLHWFGIKLGLQNTETALELLGKPHEKFSSVLVAGTNGKGSTAAFLAEMLQANGYTTGLYTSPPLVKENERFRINGKLISDNALVKHGQKVRKMMDESKLELTHFEFLTVLAFDWFAQQKIDWGVLEVGMGGRLDATNVVNAKASVISNVGLDHQQYLGNTVREIAIEKAGVIKTEKPFITTEKNEGIRQLFRDIAIGKKATVFEMKKDFEVACKSVTLEQTAFDFSGFGEDWRDIKIGLTGEHQAENAGLALATLLVLKQSAVVRCAEQKTRAALRKTQWKGRFEVLAQKPLIIADCCHNPHGAEAFAKTFQTVFPGKKVKILFGVSEGRKPEELLRFIGPLASEMVVTAAEKGIAAGAVQQASTQFVPSFKTKVLARVSDAAGTWIKSIGENDIGVVCGSIYLVGEAVQSTALKKLLRS